MRISIDQVGLGQVYDESGYFGYRYPFWCGRCNAGKSEMEPIIVHRATYWEPADGYDACPDCGSDDIGKNDNVRKIKIVRRWTLRSAK